MVGPGLGAWPVPDGEFDVPAGGTPGHGSYAAPAALSSTRRWDQKPSAL